MRNDSKSFTRRRFISTTAGLGLATHALLTKTGGQTPPNAGSASEGYASLLHQVSRGHPRLHFDAQGRVELRKRAGRTHRLYAQRLLDWVEQHRNWYPPVDVAGADRDERLLEETAAFVTNAALAFVLSENDEHLELARSWALAMLKLPRDKTNKYALGVYLAGLARAYDWMYEKFSDSERGKIREHLSEHIDHLYKGSFAGRPGETLWWADAHLHHDFWLPVGGFGEASLALLGEIDQAEIWAARAKSEFDAIFSWLGDDGAWLEGAADWCYAMAPLLCFFGAWQTATGSNPHEVEWMRNTAFFRLYHWLPDNTYVYLDDSFRSGRYSTSGSASCHLLRRLAGLYRDGYAQWLAERDETIDLKPSPKGVYQAPYEDASYTAKRIEYESSASQCAAWNVLWYDPSVEAKPPTALPPSRHFRNQGISILRTGWGDQATIASFACGPVGGHRVAQRMRQGEKRSTTNFTHAHVDYASVTLFARSQYFIVPSGYARRSSRFQNTVAVNNANLLMDPALKIGIDAHIQTPDFAYVAGDATEGFLPELKVARYRRHLVMLDRSLIVYDDLELDPSARQTRNWRDFEWRLHSDPREHELHLEDGSARWQSRRGNEPSLKLQLAQPEGYALASQTMNSAEGVPLLETLSLIRPEWYDLSMRVLAVLSWEDQPATPTRISGDGWLGLSWPDRPNRQPISFASQPLDASQRDKIGQPMVIFGADPQPGRFLRVGENGEL